MGESRGALFQKKVQEFTKPFIDIIFVRPALHNCQICLCPFATYSSWQFHIAVHYIRGQILKFPIEHLWVEITIWARGRGGGDIIYYYLFSAERNLLAFLLAGPLRNPSAHLIRWQQSRGRMGAIFFERKK